MQAADQNRKGRSDVPLVLTVWYCGSPLTRSIRHQPEQSGSGALGGCRLHGSKANTMGNRAERVSVLSLQKHIRSDPPGRRQPLCSLGRDDTGALTRRGPQSRDERMRGDFRDFAWGSAVGAAGLSPDSQLQKLLISGD